LRAFTSGTSTKHCDPVIFDILLIVIAIFNVNKIVGR
jgi:hypothetical protein